MNLDFRHATEVDLGLLAAGATQIGDLLANATQVAKMDWAQVVQRWWFFD